MNCASCNVLLPPDHIYITVTTPPIPGNVTSQSRRYDLCNNCIVTKTLRQIVNGE